jgi:methyl-accepting chemotaxis protein
MTQTAPHTLLFAIAAALAAPGAAFAQPAPAAPRAAAAAPEPPTDGLSAQDREVLATAEQLAADAAAAIEQWIITQASTEDRVFARLYFPIPKTDPQKFESPYDRLADRDLVPIEDKALAKSPAMQYAIVTDINGYVPAHNTRFSQPLSGVRLTDYNNNRTKRIFADLASVNAARNEKNLHQRITLESGDVIHEISVPITVRGKHWGCARIGYRRSE